LGEAASLSILNIDNHSLLQETTDSQDKSILMQ